MYASEACCLRLLSCVSLQEYFADYNAITSSHYTLNCLPTPLSPYVASARYRLYGDTPSTFDVSSDTGSYQRHVDGLVALLLSLKKKPIIRYERMSSMAKKLGQEVQVSQLTEVGGCPDTKHCSLGSI